MEKSAPPSPVEYNETDRFLEDLFVPLFTVRW